MKVKELKHEMHMLHNANQAALLGGQKELMPLLVLVFKKPISEFEGTKHEEPARRVLVGLGWGEQTKDSMAKRVGGLVDKYRKDLDCVVFGSDTWIASVKGKTIPKNMPRPSEHPDRKEALLTSVCTPDMSKVYAVTQTYERTKKGVKFSKKKVMGKDGEYNILEKLMGYYGN